MFEEELRESFELGRLWAEERAALAADPEETRETANELQFVIDEWPFDLNGPFVAVVSSVLGTAAAARSVNGFPSLTRDQIIAYVEHSADILDSLKHV